MKTVRFLFVLLFLAVPCFGDELPDKPVPFTVNTIHGEPQPAGRVADRAFWLEAGAMGAAWTADTITTHANYVSNPNIRESGLFFAGSRSTAKVMGAWAAVDVGAAVAGYEWKKHVHNRYLHPLWHVFMLQRVEAHTAGAASNASLP